MKLLSSVTFFLTLGVAACSSDVVGGGSGGAGTGGAGTGGAGGAPCDSGDTCETSTSTSTSSGTSSTSSGGGGQGGGGLGECTSEGGTGATTGGTIECVGDFSCEGGDVSVQCSAPEGGGEATCDCYAADAFVGSCTSPDFSTECIFPDSCCFDVFAGGGGGGGISGCEYESGTGSVGAGAPSECVSTYQCDQGQVDITCVEGPEGATCTCTSPSRTVECEEAAFACADLEGSCCAALL